MIDHSKAWLFGKQIIILPMLNPFINLRDIFILAPKNMLFYQVAIAV